MGGEVNNLKYLYHHSEVMWLLGLKYRMQLRRFRIQQKWHVVRISKGRFYYRTEIDSYCDQQIMLLPEEEQFSASLDLAKCRLAIPRHDLDLSIWIPVEEARREFVLTDCSDEGNRLRILQVMRDKVVRVLKLYYISFIYKPDLQKYVTSHSVIRN